MPEKIRALPLCDWPTADCRVWKQACVPAQRLRPGGAAARMKSSTRTSLVRAYGYLLEFCHRNGLLDQDAEAGAHVSPEIIDAFVNELHGRVGSVTRASYIGKIRRIATILAPGRDLVWLGEIEADLRYEARPRPKYHRIVSSERLLALGLELIRRGETSKHLTDLARARLVRDGLLIALLALCPIRLSNLSELRVGRQLRGIGDSWWIILEADETKTGRPDERPVPEILSGSIDRWLEHWRTVFLKPDDASWPSTKGGPLAYTYWGTSSRRPRAENSASRSTLICSGIALSTPWRPTPATAWASLPGFSSTPTNAPSRSITTRGPRSGPFADTNKSSINSWTIEPVASLFRPRCVGSNPGLDLFKNVLGGR